VVDSIIDFTDVYIYYDFFKLILISILSNALEVAHKANASLMASLLIPLDYGNSPKGYGGTSRAFDKIDL